VLTPLLGLIGPILINVIGKQVLAKGLGAQGLSELLKGQAGFLKNALPTELTRSLGITNLADLGAGASDAARRAAEYGTKAVGQAGKAAADAPSSFPNWLLPLLAILALGLLAYLFWKNANSEPGKEEAPNAASTPKKRDAVVPIDQAKAPIGEEVDIFETLDKDGKFARFVALLQSSGVDVTLKGKGPFTVLAPTDEAFGKVTPEKLDDLSKPENKDELVKLLNYHIVKGNVPASEVVNLNGKEVLTLAGNAPVTVTDDKVNIGGATVVTPDVKATNGVIHIIDTVLQP
jgi:uncharacterized surface protein with fasciclin (FAS1) repeats